MLHYSARKETFCKCTWLCQEDLELNEFNCTVDGETCRYSGQKISYTEDSGSTYLSNTGISLPKYTVSRPTIPYS